MPAVEAGEGPAGVITRSALDTLIRALARDGYRVIGPTVRDRAIVYDDIAGVADLPEGWTDEQDGGTYRLHRRADDALFGYAVGPHSWKKFLHVPKLSLWRAARADGTKISDESEASAPLAFLGVRSCDLHAIAIQDRVLMGGAYVDPHYAERRRAAFIVAVNCGEAGGTCFCASMNTGPVATSGYDLALTELGPDRFLLVAGSERGAPYYQALGAKPATAPDHAEAAAISERTAAGMGRHMEARGVRELLQANLEHPRWNDVAARCLSCANCTMVCPTCFCTSVEDASDLDGGGAERTRRWDSCFTMDFSYVHGGSVRSSTMSRYRQWMTHKLSTWWDQFDTSGCVGCGRCITWCPVGIDITEEVSAIRAEPISGATA